MSTVAEITQLAALGHSVITNHNLFEELPVLQLYRTREQNGVACEAGSYVTVRRSWSGEKACKRGTDDGTQQRYLVTCDLTSRRCQ